jgi:hypothetical protein
VQDIPLTVVKMNLDEEPDVRERYNITTLPRYSITTLPRYSITTLSRYSIITLPRYTNRN